MLFSLFWLIISFLFSPNLKQNVTRCKQVNKHAKVCSFNVWSRGAGGVKVTLRKLEFIKKYDINS